MSLNQTEREFQDAIVEYAHTQGWLAAHFRTSRTGSGGHATAVAYDGKGFPDLVLVRDRVLFVECKSTSGRLSHDQKAWREWLLSAGAEHHVWRPDDWPRIETVLRRARPQVVVGRPDRLHGGIPNPTKDAD